MEQVSKLFGNIVDCLIAPTARVEKELRRYGVKKPIVVIPSGISVDKFRNAKKGCLRKLLNLADEPIVLYAGRLGPEKSIDFIIRSFKYVLRSSPNAQLVLAGDGVERHSLESLVKKENIEKSCHFVGHIQAEDMPAVYRDADVFAFSSTSETQGLVVWEALAAGAPVVAVDDPAFECVKNGINGFLVAKKEKDFAQKISEIVLDREFQSRLSKNAVEGSGEFSVATTVDKLENVYFDVLEKHNIESVSRIMSDNERAEKVYTANIIFWTTIVVLRLWALFFNTSGAFPTVTLFGQTLLYPSLGALLILIFVAAFLHSRRVPFWAIAAVGVGTAFVADEAAALFTPYATAADYWSYLNLVPIILVGVVSGLLTRTNSGERPRFYINTREQKHTNPKNPKVSVVIPAYNEGEFIEPVLKSLINQTYKNFEIIVVDNNSSDNTGEIAAKFGARVIKQPIKGVAAARNKGFSEARGEIIASTDADSVVPENWIEKIAESYKSEKTVGFAGLNYLYSGAVSARAAGRYLFPIFWRIDKVLSGGWNMAGFNMSVRKSAFGKIGGFDPSLKMGEDIDLSQRLRTVGEVKINPSLSVYSSGRRFSKGLLAGMGSYVPWWISKVILKKDKPFDFADVRKEDSDTSKYSFVPISVLVIFLGVVFWIANLKK
jgi:glycosyltransferase involved in cell wall biosynthesis